MASKTRARKTNTAVLFTLKAPWKVNLEQYETEFMKTAGKVYHKADYYNRHDALSRTNDVWVTIKMKIVFLPVRMQ